jgi:Flp pilus assembly protein TadB
LSTPARSRDRVERLGTYAEEDEMNDRSSEPHGPEKLPDEQPVPDPADITAQAALQHGVRSRWLVPSAVLAAVAIVLFCFAFQIQLILPIIGILFVIVMWVAMFTAARASGDEPAGNRLLAWLMGGMAAGTLIIAVAIYIVESTRLPWA